MSKIEVSNLYKSYGDVDVLHDINLVINEGEFVVLVGPSGCGKSTLLRTIAGLETAKSGEIRFDGDAATDLPPQERNLSMVFQSYALYPHMSVRNNIAYGLRSRKIPKSQIAERVDKVAETLQLKALLDRRPGQLSGGQRQRVAMGRAMVREPRAFLYDEPLSNLDAFLRVDMRSEIKKLHHALGKTSIYVTHDQVEAMTLGDRIVVMNDGRIEQAGSPEVLYDDPVNVFVGGFIGSPPMNFLDVLSSEGGLRLNDETEIELPETLNKSLAEVDRIKLGFRPEQVKVTAGPDTISLRGTIVECDILGQDQMLTMELGKESARVRVSRSVGWKTGSTETFFVSQPDLRFFDAANGQRIKLDA